MASQVTALEIWLLACILLVFGALAEYAFILRQVINLSRQQRRLRMRMQLENPGAVSNPAFNSPPAVFAPGASLTANSAETANTRSSGRRNGGNSNGEEWPMKEVSENYLCWSHVWVSDSHCRLLLLTLLLTFI